jgi:hypothetical protein
MKQIFHHYQKWEDFIAGMYSLDDVIDKDKKVISAIELFNNSQEFYSTLILVLENWQISSELNLTNKTQNRRAWLGAAACMYKHNCPEYLTRVAWGLLNKNVQNSANLIAEKVIKEYEAKNNELHKGVGNKMLF